MFKILVYEKDLQSHIKNLFPSFDIDIAYNANDILDLTYEKRYDLYIVNYNCYPTMDELKKSGDKTITIFIDDYYDIFHIKKSFLIGDDYIIKPIYFEELQIRVNYHYKKLFNHAKNIISYKEFYYHINSKQLFLKNQKVKLSPNEVKLVELFLFYLGKPLSKDIIYDKLQTDSYGTLRVYISKLKKIGFDILYDRTTTSYTLNNR